ncbi:outer membrane porin [Pandoraea terrae]|uniref:Outer membrane porin n=1 Tax=Pandoraea terrae TaxID=1537710 RepID=A0A5E4TQV1_9BURK|nr:porin [Pandoraea terrae]VVD90147.1 outer membrane porin [Pandoraea terrae]
MIYRKVLLAACLLAGTAARGAFAADDSELRAKFEALQQQMSALQAQMSQVTTQMEQKTTQMEQKTDALAKAQAQSAPAIQMKPDSKSLTFLVGGGEVTLYGHGDLSFDFVNNGLNGRPGAVGKNGWLSQVSSNNSAFGIKGERKIADNLKGVFQLEADIQFAATPGNNLDVNGGGAHDSSVKGAIGSRNSFVGLAGNWGAVKLGKTDAPYKNSTTRMDPFVNTLGDMRSIMGNSGGDNRVEFATRVPHAIWYESPNIHGFSGSVLFSPGQNRTNDNSITARGEPDCTGGNTPGNSGGSCTDGAFGNLWSASLAYQNGPLYLTLAYEHHANVNRIGDELGASDGVNPPAGSVGIGDESALKAGIQYTYEPTGTTGAFIWERLNRKAPVDAFNERTRNNAFYLSLVQRITRSDEVMAAWAHAGATPGDPGGVINQPGVPLTQVAGQIDNKANMYAIGYRHYFGDKRTTFYLIGAVMKNHVGAHYDLGAGGHGVVVDDKDGAGNAFAGTTIKAVSAGITYDF